MEFLANPGMECLMRRGGPMSLVGILVRSGADVGDRSKVGLARGEECGGCRGAWARC